MNGASNAGERPESGGDALEVAAYWHGLFEDGELDAGQRERFEKWLAADPRHGAAYASINFSWSGMANAGMDDRILSMRHEALAAPRRRRGRWVRASAIAVSAGVVIAFGILSNYGSFRLKSGDGDFATRVGQRSSITLTDGSTVVLNTASRLNVAFDTNVRRVRLLAGQAWFEVAKNQSRPFVVEAGDRIVTAHGTAFDVRLEDKDTVQVTLVEGRYPLKRLERSGAGPSAVAERQDLLPGDQLTVTAMRPLARKKADVAKATSWREGQIIFDNDTLGSAVQEVNRYSVTQIILADPRLGSLSVSGVFIAGHSESFVETVTGHFPIKAVLGSDGEIVLTGTN